ncbi:MAG: iron-sulfur cluster insertion protein ErpA [Candidatus Latescibacterota bacterium]|nr:iron-sulfur cluster insertion protein ErpA [Candidatus Latescibacterota bacterium]
MVTVSDSAVLEIRSLLKREGKSPGHGLRVAVMGGGCSGFQYKLEFVEAPEEMDQVFEENGVKVFVDPKSSLYLNGVVIDYEDGLMGSGFRVENPNARTTCGCGESFSV